MPYSKQQWKDEIPDLTKPIRDSSGKQKTDPQTGRPLHELVQEGTRITSAKLNHIEDGIDAVHRQADQLAADMETPAGAQQKADGVLAAAQTYTDTGLLSKADKSATYSKTETDHRIQAVVGAAPDALDTLKEIGDALNNDPNFAATMTTQLAGKVDKVPGKQLSTEDFTAAEKMKLAGLTTGAGAAGSATDSVIGNRTIVDTTAPGDTGTLTGLLSGLANMIKQITGGATWRTAPSMTIAAIKTILDAATNAATASTLIKRDSAGRAKVAAPSAADDIAIKSTVDDAKTAAIAASIPLAQKGVAGGVAELDANKFMMASGMKLTGYSTEHILRFEFANGVANQKVNMLFSAASGFFELTIASSYNFANATGKLTKRFEGTFGGDGNGFEITSEYTDVTGKLKNYISIGEPVWDSTSHYWKIPIEARIAHGNAFALRFSSFSSDRATTASLSEVYTGAATTLPVAVQTIPDNTVTQSGYLIQKHKLSENNGSGIWLPPETDLDNVVKTGFYDGTGLIHQPLAGTMYWYIEVQLYSGHESQYVRQRATQLNSSGYKPIVYERIRDAGTWGGWAKVWNSETDEDLFTINGYVSGDVNNLTELGTYVFFEGSFTNGPDTGISYGLLKVFIGLNGYLVQEATAVTAPYAKSYRVRTETVWSPWRRVLTDADSSSFSPAMSGVGKIGDYITNADTLYDNGFYNVPATWTGSPFAGTDGYNQGYVNHLSWNNGVTYACQLFMPINAVGNSKAGPRYRRKINGTWTEWVPVWGAENDSTLMTTRNLPTTNLNDAVTTGMYLLGTNSTYTNGSGLDWCLMKVYQNSAGYVEQEATGVGSRGRRYRVRTETGAWSQWDSLLTNVDLADTVQGTHTYAVTTGTAAALAASITPAPAVLSAGLRLSIKTHVATTGPVTLNLNGLGAKSIKKPNGNDPSLALGGVYTVVYDGSAFILQGEGGEYGNVSAGHVLAGIIFGTENGLDTGKMPNRPGQQSALSMGANGTNLYARIPLGGYVTAVNGANAEIVIPYSMIASNEGTTISGANIRSGVTYYGVPGNMSEYTRFDGSSSTLSLAPGVTNGWTLPSLNPLHALFITDPSGNIMHCAAYRSQSEAYAILNSNNLVLTLSVNGTSSSCTVKNNNSFTSVIMFVVIGPR